MSSSIFHGETVFPWDEALDYSPYVRVDDNLVFTSGQGAFGEDGSIQFHGDPVEQIRLTFDNLRTVLSAAGASLSAVITLTVYLSRPEDFEHLKSVRREYFSAPFPAVTTVRADLLPEGMLIELQAVARISDPTAS